MAFTQLTEVDFDQIKNNLVEYLKSTGEFSDYDFSGSNLQVILNLLAYTSQVNAYTANMVANESILATSTIRNNVVANAKALGYLPSSERASFVFSDLTFQLDPLDYSSGFPQFITIESGVLLSTSSGKESFIFNILEDQTSSVTNQGRCVFSNIPSYEGIYISQTFVVDTTDSNQRFIIENQLVDTNTIKIEVQEDSTIESNEFYQRSNSITSLTPDSRVYWINEISENNYEITFGDGLFGKSLKNGARIFVNYLVTNGKLANGVRDQYAFVGRVFDSFGNRVITDPQVSILGPSTGGSDLETVSSIKFRAPKAYAMQERCVTSSDYEEKIKQIYPAIEDIYVFGGEELRIPEYGRIYAVIKPISGNSLANTTKEFIKNSLKDYRIASLDIQIVDPDVLYVELDSLVFFDDTKTLKDASSITTTVRKTLTDYANSPFTNKFGGVLRYSKIISAIDDSDLSITRNNTTLRMRKDIKIVQNTRSSYEICFENPLNMGSVSSMRNVLRSTGFKLIRNGILDNKTYYFEDSGDGNIVLFYFDSLNTKIIEDKYFGTVDYDIGEVKIGFINPITFYSTEVGNSIIEVRALPKNQDIESTKTVYLEIDVSKSDIESVVDVKRGN